MKLALQIGIGIIIGVFGCWIVAIFFTAAVVAALPHRTVDLSHMISESRPIHLPTPSLAQAPAPRPVVIARSLVEATGEPSNMLVRPEYQCIRDRSQHPVAITCTHAATINR
jgi:hypothetical protein